MDVKKVLYISQEIHPYVPANEVSTMCCDLPRGIQEKGIEVRTDHPLIIKVATLQPTRMQVYFMDNDDYFERHTTKGLETDIHPDDNDERSMFFVRGSVETVKKLRWDASVVHCPLSEA